MDNTNEVVLPNMVCIMRIKNEVLPQVLLVPNESLLQSSSGNNYVYIIKKGKKHGYAHKIDIKPGPSDENYTVVLANPDAKEELKAGDHVITVGARGVKEGMEVKIK